MIYSVSVALYCSISDKRGPPQYRRRFSHGAHRGHRGFIGKRTPQYRRRFSHRAHRGHRGFIGKRTPQYRRRFSHGAHGGHRDFNEKEDPSVLEHKKSQIFWSEDSGFFYARGLRKMLSELLFRRQFLITCSRRI
jgi:hypothetical protein